MSRPELTALAERIVTALATAAAALQRLGDGLVRRRTAWIAARPETLHEPVTALEHTARELQDETTRLRELFAAVVPYLPPALQKIANLHVDADLVAGHLPPLQAARLRAAGARCTEQAARVRREQALGERLLRFSQHAHDSLLHRLAQQASSNALDIGSYDRTARRVASAFQRAAAPGSLVDGRM